MTTPARAIPNTSTKRPFELGIYSFVKNTPDPATGITGSPAQRMADLLEEIELADQVGLDVFGIGEHHRSEYLASSPVVILAAAAARTQKIRLSSAVTVLSSDDPVRVFQDFATLDLISKGRDEIVAGRGSFIESFPLFGYDLNHYHELFTDSLEQAFAESFPSVAAMMNTIGRERGWSPMTRGQYLASSKLKKHLALGDPEMITEKILYQQQILGHGRYSLQLSVGTLLHPHMMHAIELFGTQVAPVVRNKIAKQTASSMV